MGRLFNGTVTDNLQNKEIENLKKEDNFVGKRLEVLDSNLDDLKILGWSVPTECPIQNEINGNQFILKVGRVDLGTLEYTFSTDYISLPSFASTSAIAEMKNDAKGYSEYYGALKQQRIDISSNNQIALANNVGDKRFVITNSSYTDATTFKNAMKGVYLYYELATPITMTIDGNEAITKINESLNSLITYLQDEQIIPTPFPPVNALALDE